MSGFRRVSTSGPLTSPSIPASGVALRNPFGCTCVVYIDAASSYSLKINATTIYSTPSSDSSLILSWNDTVTLTYTQPPVGWKWWKLVA